MKCPICQSEDIQKLEVVYLKEVGTFNSLGASISEGGGVGLSMTRGGISSLLAKKLEPPKLRTANTEYKWFLIYSNIFIAIAILILMGIIDEGSWHSAFILLFFPCFIALLLLKSYKKRKIIFEEAISYNQTIFPKLYKEWQDSWYCNKCGNIFQILEFKNLEELSK